MNENLQGNEENRMPASEVLEDRTDHPLLHPVSLLILTKVTSLLHSYIIVIDFIRHSSPFIVLLIDQFICLSYYILYLDFVYHSYILIVS